MNRLTECFFDSPVNVFAPHDVTVALSGTSHSRNALIKRAIANDEIINIRRGLYCLAPRYCKKPINIYSIAQHVYGPSYISLESALNYHGWIPEAVYVCTNVSMKNSKKFATPLGLFRYTRVPQKIFYAGIERLIDSHGNVYFMAKPIKALADYVYAHKVEWRGIGEAVESLRIEPEEFDSINPNYLKSLAENYKIHRVRKFLNGVIEELK